MSTASGTTIRLKYRDTAGVDRDLPVPLPTGKRHLLSLVPTGRIWHEDTTFPLDVGNLHAGAAWREASSGAAFATISHDYVMHLAERSLKFETDTTSAGFFEVTRFSSLPPNFDFGLEAWVAADFNSASPAQNRITWGVEMRDGTDQRGLKLQYKPLASEWHILAGPGTGTDTLVLSRGLSRWRWVHFKIRGNFQTNAGTYKDLWLQDKYFSLSQYKVYESPQTADANTIHWFSTIDNISGATTTGRVWIAYWALTIEDTESFKFAGQATS